MVNLVPNQNKYMVKIMYDELLKRLDNPTIGFPNSNDGKLHAEKICVNEFIFIYVTSPIQRVIGMAKVVDSYFIANNRWPYQVPVDWVISPKNPGVMLKDVEINYRPQRGDSEFWISSNSAKKLIDMLQKQYDYY
mgnify:CR=1 FL=1